MEKCGI